MKPLQSIAGMKFRHILAATALSAACGTHAQGAPTSAPAAPHAPETAAPQSDGEVRKVDKAQGKLTLRHGPLKHFDMPAMTMVFRVADPKMLDGLKEGDKVKFTAEKVNGAFTVTALQAAR